MKNILFSTNLFIFIFVFIFSTEVYSKLNVLDVNMLSKENKNILRINFNGELYSLPKFEVKNNIVQIILKSALVWPKIEKKIFFNKKNNITLLAYQFSKDIVRVRALLPSKITFKKSDIQILVSDNKIEAIFPSKIKNSISNLKKNQKNDYLVYDEKLLVELLKDNKKIHKNNTKVSIDNQNSHNIPQKDSVKLKMSSLGDIRKESFSDEFSVASYLGKFMAFLGIVLIFFYGIIRLLKKGAFGKSKLNFLNKMNTVSVLTSTYLAPKKNIHVVKAHNQIFLLATSDKGVHFLSELDDVSGILKKGEYDIAGNNFDSALELSKKDDFKVEDILKDDVDRDRKNDDREKIELKKSDVKKTKFSEQIKNKVKDLKSFQ